MEYLTVDLDAKRQVLHAQIKEAETEHYATSVTVELAHSLADDPSTNGDASSQYRQQGAAAERRLHELTLQIEKYHAMLEDLG